MPAGRALAALLIAAALAAPRPADAQEPSSRVVASFRDWRVVVGFDERGKVCYAASTPTARTPFEVPADDAWLFVAMRAGQVNPEEVSVEFGRAASGDATVTVGDRDFPFLTQDKGAWIRNTGAETELVTVMHGGDSLTVRFTAPGLGEVRDRYSLAGFGEALARARQECAEPRPVSGLRPVPQAA